MADASTPTRSDYFKIHSFLKNPDTSPTMETDWGKEGLKKLRDATNKTEVFKEISKEYHKKILELEKEENMA